MAKPLYVFDLDHTLIDGDSSTLWSEYLVREGIIADPDYLPVERQLMALYGRGEMDIAEYIQFTLQPLSAMDKSAVDALVADFVGREILPRVFPQASALIARLRQENIPMLIISATVSLLVAAIAPRIGVEHAIGVDVVIENHCYRGRIAGVPSYQQGKIVRLSQWLAQFPHDGAELHFYTDSINDLPLCEQADRVYLVNPDARLAEAGQRHHWPVLAWHRQA